MKTAILKSLQELKENLQREAERKRREAIKSLYELRAKLQREAEKKRREAKTREDRRFVKDELARLDKVVRKIKARKKKEKKTPKLHDPIASGYVDDGVRHPDPGNWVGNRK